MTHPAPLPLLTPGPHRRYCYRQAELGIGDCGGLNLVPGMTKNGKQKSPEWLQSLLGVKVSARCHRRRCIDARALPAALARPEASGAGDGGVVGVHGISRAIILACMLQVPEAPLVTLDELLQRDFTKADKE
jgi:hypothetical protein